MLAGKADKGPRNDRATDEHVFCSCPLDPDFFSVVHFDDSF